MEKLCAKCTMPKDLSEFHKEKKGNHGVGHWCKECAAKERRKWDEKNRDYANERAQKYRKGAKNISYEKEFRKVYVNTFDGVITRLLSASKRRAKLKNLAFDLDREWIIKKVKPMICEATGLPLSLEIDNRYQHSPFKPSIDKIDPKKGYIKDNCQIVAVIYNKAKADSPALDVLLMAQCLMEKSHG